MDDVNKSQALRLNMAAIHACYHGSLTGNAVTANFTDPQSILDRQNKDKRLDTATATLRLVGNAVKIYRLFPPVVRICADRRNKIIRLITTTAIYFRTVGNTSNFQLTDPQSSMMPITIRKRGDQQTILLTITTRESLSAHSTIHTNPLWDDSSTRVALTRGVMSIGMSMTSSRTNVPVDQRSLLSWQHRHSRTTQQTTTVATDAKNCMCMRTDSITSALPDDRPTTANNITTLMTIAAGLLWANTGYQMTVRGFETLLPKLSAL